jgi:hypothetical protein
LHVCFPRAATTAEPATASTQTFHARLLSAAPTPSGYELLFDSELKASVTAEQWQRGQGAEYWRLHIDPALTRMTA